MKKSELLQIIKEEISDVIFEQVDLDDHTKNLLISMAKKYDLVSMNWGK